jgi:hypothetical protein
MKTPAELNPRITELENKRNILHAEKAAKVAEAAAIRVRLQNAPSNGNAAENRVRVILGESPLPDSAPDMLRLDALLSELHDINIALSILDHAIQKEKTIGSRLVCEAERPEVTKRAKAFAKALINLRDSQIEYHTYLDKLEDTGATISSLPRVFIHGIGHANDPCGGFHFAFRELVDGNYISKSEVPVAIR